MPSLLVLGVLFLISVSNSVRKGKSFYSLFRRRMGSPARWWGVTCPEWAQSASTASLITVAPACQPHSPPSRMWLLSGSLRASKNNLAILEPPPLELFLTALSLGAVTPGRPDSWLSLSFQLSLRSCPLPASLPSPATSWDLILPLRGNVQLDVL